MGDNDCADKDGGRESQKDNEVGYGDSGGKKKDYDFWSRIIWIVSKSACIIFLAGIFGFKMYSDETKITIDFPVLLSLLLALFSVWLSALFYFKANETSNAFYDNSYKFTKDIAQLLIKIESGFGERLKNLDEGYSSFRSYIQGGGKIKNNDVEATEKEVASGQEEADKVMKERSEMINELLEKTQLHQNEKEAVLQQLKDKDIELAESHEKLARLNKSLEKFQIERNVDDGLRNDKSFRRYVIDNVIDKIGAENVIGRLTSDIRRKFNKVIESESLHRQFLKDLNNNGFYNFDSGLTIEGAKFFRELAREVVDREKE